jgi:Fur family transcriptional regulator, ferric uptake regulator
MTAELEVLTQLSGRGFRVTQARRAIVRALLDADGSVTPAQASELARRHWPTVGLVTAYRTLELLTQLGLARRIHLDDGCHSYVSASYGHRHDLICHECGRVVEFDGCDLSELLERVHNETGFYINAHMLELSGICPRCQKGAPLADAGAHKA